MNLFSEGQHCLCRGHVELHSISAVAERQSVTKCFPKDDIISAEGTLNCT